MINREKIQKGINACINEEECLNCPYDAEYERSCDCMEALIKDMAELLKAQEPITFQVDLKPMQERIRETGEALASVDMEEALKRIVKAGEDLAAALNETSERIRKANADAMEAMND